MMTIFAQIQRWLRQSEVWRIVGFAAAVIGLLCYAISSSFNHLFGNWNLLKIFLYSVISFAICLLILFAKVWQYSTSLRLKAHLTFLLLAITSVYSFFYDRGVNGKPDVYGLISSAAFAIMSLSLSRQTHCGFEVDLLYFFLGCLNVQLMKIKLSLALVGVGFSYSLIILRSSLDGPPPDTGYIGLQDQPHVVIQVDSQQSNTGSELVIMPQEGNTQDLVITQVDLDSQQANTDSALLMPKLMACIKALGKENQRLILVLARHVGEYLQSKVDLNSKSQQKIMGLPKDHKLVIDELPSKIVNDLRETVKLMVDAGLEEDCRHMYISCRRKFLKMCLSELGLPEFNDGYVHSRQKTWCQMWIQTSNIALLVLFPNERTLCDYIFSDFTSIADLSFMEVCSELTKNLLNFANSLANGSRLPNLRSSIIRVLETLGDMIPEFESLFSYQHSVWLWDEAITIRKSLGEATRGIFKELENQIRCDTKMAAVPQGGIDPTTSQVLEFLRNDCVLGARDTLTQVYQEQLMASDREGTSSFSVQIARILELLQVNLEAKSKIYSDPVLGYVFMMKNGRCIQQTASFYMGHDWIEKHQAKVQKNFEHYQRCSWDKILDFLKLDSSESVAAYSMIEKLKLFNMHFKEICSVQSKWFVSDQWLKDEIRESLKNILLPAYGNFLGRFEKVLGKHADEYIEYGMFQIEDQLDSLFVVSQVMAEIIGNATGLRTLSIRTVSSPSVSHPMDPDELLILGERVKLRRRNTPKSHNRLLLPSKHYPIKMARLLKLV